MKVFEFPQYSADWWATRRGVPTASNFDNILTATGKVSTSREPYACRLVAEKFDAFYSQSPEYESVAMAEGTHLEPEARRYYEFHRECSVREVGFCLTDDGKAGCSPDALVGEDGVLELKAPQPRTHVQYLVEDRLPPAYRQQCHGHLIVTGRAFCDFLSYCPGLPPVLIRVEPDEYTEQLRKALNEFWTLYQEILARVEARHAEYINEEIDRRATETPKPLQSFVA